MSKSPIFSIPSSPIPTSSSSPQTLENKINGLTDLQIRMLMSSIFAQRGEVKDESELDENLVKMRDSWCRKDGDPFLSRGALVDKIKKTMKDTHDYFAQQGLPKDSLKENSAFANYMIGSVLKDDVGTGQAEANQGMYYRIMYDFCNYSCQVSLREQEQQKVCLESFPPEGVYLNCFDGTKKRIEDLYDNLTDSEQHRPFVHAHGVVIKNVVDFLKYSVFQGNEVHIPNYLDYSLGLKKEKDIYPQSQIPAVTAWTIHREFSPYFRQELLKEMMCEEQERRGKIAVIVQNIVEGFPNVDLGNFSIDEDVVAKRLGEEVKSDVVKKAVEEASACIQAINSGLAAYEVGGKGFVKSDAVGNAYFDQALLNQSAIATSALEFLNEFLEQEKVAILSAEKPNKQVSLEALRKADKSVIFSEATIRNVLILLTAADGIKPVNHDETLAGLELLWMMGDHLAGNCPIAFVGIERALNQMSPDYLTTKITPQIEKFLPDQVEKIQRIQERFEILNADQNIVPFLTAFERPKVFFNAPLGNLFYGNAPQEVITRRIEAASSASALISELDTSLKALVPHPLTQSSSEISPYSWACRQLMLRPDSQEILGALLKKMEKEVEDAKRRNPTVSTNPSVLPTEFISECLAMAAQNNQTKNCQFLINKFGTTTEIFNGNPAIHYAAMYNNTELMGYYVSLLTHAGELSRVTEQQEDIGNTAAVVAAMHGSAEVIKTMHEKGIPLSKLNQTGSEEGNALVHVAALYGKANVVKTLFDLGDDLNAVANGNFTVAHCAAQEGYANVIEILADAGITAENLNVIDDEDYTPMDLAIHCNHKNIVVALGEAGVRDHLLRQVCGNGDAPIHLAAVKGRANLVELLSGFGADLNQKNSAGDAPIHIAINKNHPEMVVALGKAGADLEVKDKDNRTPLTLAIRSKSVSAIKALKEGGLNFAKVNSHGNNLMHLYAPKGDDGIVKLLADAEVDFDQFDTVNSVGQTPVMIAIQFRHTGFIRALKDAGMNLDKEDEAGHSLMYRIVKAEGMPDVSTQNAKVLIDSGANINHKNRDGDTALHLAVLEGNLEAFKILKTLGADLKQLNQDGETPFDFALRLKRFDIVREYDLDASIRKDEKYTVLNLAIFKRDVVAVENLISAGINLTTTSDATTYLNHAAYTGNVAIVDLLLSHKDKIDINMLDPADETALHYAALGKQVKMMQHLRALGAKDVENCDGNLPDAVLAAEMEKAAQHLTNKIIVTPPPLPTTNQDLSPTSTTAIPLPSPPTETLTSATLTSAENVVAKSKPSQHPQHPNANNGIVVNDNVNLNL